MKDNLWAGEAQPNTSFLLQVVKLPIVIIVLAEIILIILTERYWQEVYWWLDYQLYFFIGIDVLAGFWAGYLLSRSVKNRINLAQPAYTAGALAGLLAGLLLAIFKIFWYHKFWTFFNLISEPLMLGFLGAVLVRWSVSLFDKIFKN
ncbi:MAG: hypothetical protein V1684_02405 [bacterium]